VIMVFVGYRALACILETNWDAASKRLRIPAVLRPYMDGMEYITVDKQH
jgi:seryl-tRNA synthetase